MNVKPGDNARIVDTETGLNHQRLVSVLSDCCKRCNIFTATYGKMWRCATLQSMECEDGFVMPAGTEQCIPDTMLRPLPGITDAAEAPLDIKAELEGLLDLLNVELAK